MIQAYSAVQSHALKLSLSALLICGVGLTVFPGIARAQQDASQEDGLILTAGVGYGRSVFSAGGTKARAFPVVDAYWQKDRFFAGLSSGVGYYWIQDKTFKLSTSLNFEPGRRESDDKLRLRGLGDVKASLGLGLNAQWNPIEVLSVNAGVRRAAQGSKGTITYLGLGTGIPLNDKLTLTGGINANFADAKYMQAYYGVTAAQSTRSGYRAFAPKSGVESVDVSIGAQYVLDKQWSVITSAGVSRLQGDARKSPFINKTSFPSTTVAVSYRF